MSQYLTGNINDELDRRLEERKAIEKETVAELKEARETLAELKGELSEAGFRCEGDIEAIIRDIEMTKAIIRDLNFQIWGVREL
jgi:predicted component of type VI protein secretion system